MGKIIGTKDMQKLAQKADTTEFFDAFENLLSSDALKAAFRAALEGAYEDEETEKILEEASVDIASRIDNPMALYPIGICIPEGILRDAFAKGVTKAYKTVLTKPTYTKDIIANVASLSLDEKFIRDCYEHPEKYGIEGSEHIVVDSHQSVYKDDLEIYQEYKEIERKKALGDDKTPEEKWGEADPTFYKTSYIPPVFKDKIELGPLDFTELEKYSIRLYEGAAPRPDNAGGGELARTPSAYMTLNMMFFDGIENELERIFDDRKILVPSALSEADEILDRSLDLFTAMYKYGKRMSEDKIGYRVDRASSARQVYEEGHTISNFSTSMRGYNDAFSKKNIALVELIVRRGTPCADFKEILGYSNYTLAGEREILVAPLARITSKRPRKPESYDEKAVRDFDGKEAQAVYEMEASAPESARELTPMEEADLERKEKIFNDKARREKAAMFLAKLHSLSELYMNLSSEDALECVDPKELQEYLEWKEAYQDIYRYKTRQIMLDIDKKIAENQRMGRTLYFYSMDYRTPEQIKQDEEAAYAQEEIDVGPDMDDTLDLEDTAEVPIPSEEELAKENSGPFTITREEFESLGMTEEDLRVYGIVVDCNKPKMEMSSVEEMVSKRDPEKVASTGKQMLDSLGKMVDDKDPKKDDIR